MPKRKEKRRTNVLMKEMVRTSKWFTEKQKRLTDVLMKKIVSTRKWFTAYWIRIMPRRNKNRKRRTHIPLKKMVGVRKWFMEYWFILAVIFIAVASWVIYFQWILTALSP